GGNRHAALASNGDDLVVGDDHNAVLNRRGAGAIDHASGVKDDGAGAFDFLCVRGDGECGEEEEGESHRREGRQSGTACAFSTAGKYTVNTVPAPSVLSTRMSPPDCFTIPYAVESPSPVPRPGSFVVKNGSKICAIVSCDIPWPVSE